MLMQLAFRPFSATSRLTLIVAFAVLFVTPDVAYAQAALAGASTNTVTVHGPSDLTIDARGGGGYPLALGGSDTERVFETATDDAGNVYVTGDFYGTIDFDPGPGQAIASSAGGSDFFAASYDSGGALRWAFRYGTASTELGSGIAVADGRVFFGGVFNGVLNLGTAGSVTSAGSLDGVVIAVDANTGSFIWVSSFGGALADGNPRLATAGGRVFVDARFIGPADFDDGPGQTILNGSASYDTALAAYSADTGALLWARSIFGGTGQQFEGGVDATATTVYATANSYGNRNGMVGAYTASSGAPIFETGTPGIAPVDVAVEGNQLFVSGAALPDANTSNIWVAAYNSSGAQSWAHTLVGPGNDNASSIASLGGRVYVGGSFEQTVDFDPGSGTASRTSSGDSDAFVALYEAATGAFVQAERLGGSGFDQAYAVTGGTSSGVVAGTFSDTADLDPTPGETATRTAIDSFDGFVALYFPDGRPTGFAVTTAADAGAGSMRQAMLDANAAGGGTITFAIPGVGPHTIALTSALPSLTASIVIDGFSQPGAQANTAAPWQPSNAVHKIVVSGAALTEGSGIWVQGDGSVVRGLAIVDFPWHGVLLLSGSNIAVEGCIVGTDDAGTTGLGNGFSGIWVNNSATARIGGASPAARNVISGNVNFGVLVYGAGASGTKVQGNFIGTAPDGATRLGNGFSAIFTGSNVVFAEPNPSEAIDVRIGGTEPGEGNVLSGSIGFGIEIYGFDPNGNATTLGDTRVEGNRIGTNAAGTAAIPNNQSGILVRRNPTGITIGGEGPGAGNVVSGNRLGGLLVEVSDAVLIEGNLVGTDATGTLPLGNGQTGISLICSRNAVVRGNVASANGRGTGNFVGSGVGATCPFAGFTGSGNRIVGNWIGTDRSGTIPLGNAGNNGQAGVTFSRAHTGDTLGGDDPADANVIAFNAGPGVIVRDNIAGPIALKRNALYGNTGIGIDLEPSGRAVNDAGDADAGANRQQNYPVFASAAGGGGTLTLTYTIDTAAANATFPLEVDFYAADADNEEGRTWIGRHVYTTPQAQAVAALNPAENIADGTRIVATARDAAGNTSEFSDPITLSGGVVDSESDPGSMVLSMGVQPNPVSSHATVALALGEAAKATVEVFDALGRRVARVHDGPLSAGTTELPFDSSGLPAGTYVIRAQIGATMVSRRLTVVR